MECTLKDKIEVTEEFLLELIAKSWQESEAIQQQIANIDTSTALGAEVVKSLKNMGTSYYVLIGCLENLADGKKPDNLDAPEQVEAPAMQEVSELETVNTSLESEDLSMVTEQSSDFEFEPFEYFVDFDEPSGAPISDKELYG
jgi:hypothetical protein